MLEPEAKGDESRPEGTPKKEEAANDGMADGGFNAGKEPPRKPPGGKNVPKSLDSVTRE